MLTKDKFPKFIFTILLLISHLPIVKGGETSSSIVYTDEHLQDSLLTPIDESIAIAAPHLPIIQKFDGSGSSFKYKKNTYNVDENILKLWIQTYPKEFDDYCVAMKILLKETKTSSLSPIMKTIYTDLRAQYVITKKITNN
jgi:hypothetical protein